MNEINNPDKFNENSQKLFKKFFKEGDLVFDVGANDGKYTRSLLKIGARVIAFEPQNSCISTLKRVFQFHPKFTLEPIALGAEKGQQTMHVCSGASTISSLSTTWIHAVSHSGRFNHYQWPGRQIVEVDTLDNMIKKHGIPAFMKIDVEGFEYEVLQGLSVPVPALSMEFTPEVMDGSINCIKHLSAIGDYEFNLSRGVTMEFDYPEWLSNSEMIDKLVVFQKDRSLWGEVRNGLLWGDVYCRLQKKM